MCQACRGLIAASERTCPLCGRDSVPDAPVAVKGAQSTRFFTLLFIGINVAIYVLMVVVSMNAGAPDPLMNGAPPAVLVDFGERFLPAIANGEWWRLITPMFIHLGLMHLFFNSTALYQIGPMIEESYGSQKFVFVYILTGLIGNIGSFVFHIQGAGASGAIYGLIGIAAVYGYKVGGTFGRGLMRQMLIWAGIGMVLSLIFHWDIVNHAFGMATGALAGYVLYPGAPAGARAALRWNIVAIACSALIAVSFGMVAINYGKQAKAQDIVMLDRRVRVLQQSLANSFDWQGSTDGDPHKLANDIRSAADDVNRIPHIDKRSDDVKRSMVDLAAERVGALEAADKDPKAATGPAMAEMRAASDQLRQYESWVDSILKDYNLEKTEGK
ncbi:MAG TPA: rhomboid family intramembrane serine protease [Blastocatellia bacterium]|nr:rhomboid family intramembrane serine protease [Blastocatellia bacterium]